MKSRLYDLYDAWYVSEKKTFTEHGNPRAPSKTDLCDMVVAAWNDISNELIRKSFLVCGQAIESMPDDISCLKTGRTASAALSTVKEIWQNPLSTGISDVFDDNEDEDELHRNEIVVFEEGFETNESPEIIDPLENLGPLESQFEDEPRT